MAGVFLYLKYIRPYRNRYTRRYDTFSSSFAAIQRHEDEEMISLLDLRSRSSIIRDSAFQTAQTAPAAQTSQSISSSIAEESSSTEEVKNKDEIFDEIKL